MCATPRAAEMFAAVKQMDRDRVRTVLSEKDALRIFYDQRPREEVAADFGISISTVYDIQAKRTWAHLHTQEEG